MAEPDYDKLREMIARCQWTFAKTMPWAPHEYIVRGKCPLTEEEFVYFVNMQREHGVKEHWGKYFHPYLYTDVPILFISAPSVGKLLATMP